MEAQWHYVDQQQQTCSARASELGGLLQRRVVTVDTLVWAKGEPGWKPLKAVPVLAPVLAAAQRAGGGGGGGGGGGASSSTAADKPAFLCLHPAASRTAQRFQCEAEEATEEAMEVAERAEAMVAPRSPRPRSNVRRAAS